MTDAAVPAARAGLRPPRALGVVAAAALVGVGGGAAVALTRPAAAPALPELHGQATWAQGVRPAPGFALRGPHGVVSLASLRGRTVVLAFLRSRCDRCGATAAAIARAVEQVAPAQRPVVVAVGGGGPKGALRLVGGAARVARLRAAYRAGAWGHAIFLIDRSGGERAAYAAPFLPGFVAHDLAALAEGA